MIDFLSIGDTQYDTVMVLKPEEVDIRCELDTKECMMGLDYAGKLPVSELHAMVAGNAANGAITAVRLQSATAFWSLLGDDDIARRQLHFFQQEGVNSTWLQRVLGGQSNQSTVISVDGERTILVYHAPRQYVLPENLPNVKWIYLTSMGHGSESIFSDLASYVSDNNIKLAFQPGTFQLRLGAEQSKEILKVTEYIVMNKEEAQKYTGHEQENDIPKLCQALRDFGPTIAVVTDGKRGSYASNGDELWKMGIRPEIPRVESTGAGDAYSSAFAVALMKGEPIHEAIRWGALNSEGVIQQFGPQAGILTLEQMQQQLEDNSDFKPEKIG